MKWRYFVLSPLLWALTYDPTLRYEGLNLMMISCATEAQAFINNAWYRVGDVVANSDARIEGIDCEAGVVNYRNQIEEGSIQLWN